MILVEFKYCLKDLILFLLYIFIYVCSIYLQLINFFKKLSAIHLIIHFVTKNTEILSFSTFTDSLQFISVTQKLTSVYL